MFFCLPSVSYQEEKIFQSYQGPIPELFKRFLDDGMGATSMPRYDLEKFISFVCNFHPALQFEYQISSSCLSFLDIKLQITDNHITTSIFYKKTDSHSYLDNDSFHNPKCITSIPFSELLCLWHLCSDDEDFKTKANEMSIFLFNCNYSPNTIQSAINRIPKISKAKALQPRPKQSTTERTPLVLTYHPHMHQIKHIFLQNFKKILQQEKSDTNRYLLRLLYWPTDVTPTSSSYSSGASLIQNQMLHTPVDMHYASPVNTPILPMPYLVPRTLSIFNTTLLAHLSVLSTQLLVPNAPLYIL